MKRLVCIGDSHASFFSGENKIQPEYPGTSVNKIPNLEGVRLGAVLAYSLHKNNTSSRGREKLFEKLATLDPNNDGVMLCFGEVDCRCHLIKQSDIQGHDIRSIVEECVDKYFQVVREVKQLGFKVFVWNVIPTSYDDLNKEYPHYGSHRERNKSTVLFNQLLEEKCHTEGIYFVSIFNKLVSWKYYTKGYMLYDGVHLGQVAMPYFFTEINRVYPGIELGSVNKSKWYGDLVREIAKYSVARIENNMRKIARRILRKNKK